MKCESFKSAMAWLLVRFIGLILVLIAIIGAVRVGVVFFFAAGYGAFGSPLVLALLYSVILPLLVGAYFLRDGEFAYNCLMFDSKSDREKKVSNAIEPRREPKPPKPPKPPKQTVDRTTGLSETEMKVFSEWLAKNPENQNRPLIDQVALFRDSDTL